MLSDANQSPPLVDFDRYASDAALREAVAAYGAQAREPELREIGLRAGSAEAIAWGDDANAHPPVLRAFDARGNRIDEVDYHPSYHRLMAAATRFGLHASSWSEPGAGAQVARAAGFYLWSQVDAGHGCPISMTHAAFPLLQRATALGTEWPAALLARSYDPSLRPIAQKGSALVGMALTERQGGSDLRANQTRALPLGARGPGERYALDGHKWFCSAPMSDAFLVLAQAPDGLSCFFVPRVLEDGTRNPFPLQRLKDKLGNRSNASSEVEFEGTLGTLVGEEGRGIATIVEMVNLTRLDCTIGSAAGMRQAALHAIHHARHRSAFGAPLSEAPAMRAVLADLALEAEAAIHLALRLARALDGAAAGDIRERAFARLATAVGKFFVCKRAPGHAYEALECLGGNGYVETWPLARVYREAPVNAIWEGSGNVVALDALRALAREPESLDAFFTEIALARGADRRLDAAAERLRAALATATRDPSVQADARRLVATMGVLLEASLLVRFAPPAVADAFSAARLGEDRAFVYGELSAGLALAPILARWNA